jgi:hypothetical protein
MGGPRLRVLLIRKDGINQSANRVFWKERMSNTNGQTGGEAGGERDLTTAGRGRPEGAGLSASDGRSGGGGGREGPRLSWACEAEGSVLLGRRPKRGQGGVEGAAGEARAAPRQELLCVRAWMAEVEAVPRLVLGKAHRCSLYLTI